MLAATKYWRRQSIRINKILAPTKIYESTKYWRRQKSTRREKYRSRQNIGVDKILASTKSWRRQNVGVDKIWASTKILASTKKVAQAERWRGCSRISLLLGSTESAAADFSQAPLKISYFSLMVLFSMHAVVKWGIASSCPVFMGDSLPYCTGLLYRPAKLKMSKTLAPTKYRCPPKIHWFSPNYSSLYFCSQASYQKVVKTKKWSPSLSNISFYTHNLQIRGCPRDPPLWPLSVEMGSSFYTHNLQIRGCPRDPPLWPLSLEMGCGWRGGEGGPLLVPPSTCLASRWNGLPQDNTPLLSYKYLFLLLHLPLSHSKLDRGGKKNFRTICAEQHLCNECMAF